MNPSFVYFLDYDTIEAENGPGVKNETAKKRIKTVQK